MRNGTKMRRWLSGLLLLVLVLSTAAPAMAERGKIYYSSVSGLRIRKEAKSGSEIIAKLYRGGKCMHLSTSKGWWKVRLGNGKTGYCWPTYLRLLGNGNLYRKNARYRLTQTVAARKSASTAAKSNGNIKKGTLVKLTARKGTWGKVRSTNGRAGWVLLKYLSYYSG